jgi:hypoxanthine phosphoribosyltransferase
MIDLNKITPTALITQQEIAVRVQQIADELSVEYAGRELLAVGILKGSWVFLADLVRKMTIPVTIDFMSVSSYGASTRTSGVVKIVLDLKCPLENRDVLVVEDILDTGLTLKYIVDNLKTRGPRSLRIATLMDKPDRRRADIKADWVGFKVPDKFVVGYGADYAERFRDLPYIGYIEEPKAE